MDIQVLRTEEEIKAVIIRNALTVDRNILKQLPIFGKFNGYDEMMSLEVFGWVAGIMIDRSMSEYRYALVKNNDRLGLVKMNYSAWDREFLNHLNQGGQIFVV